MWFCHSDLFCVHYFSCRKPFIDISIASKSHLKKPHLRYFCTILHKGMLIPWISLHRWMFGPLYLFICCLLTPFLSLSPLSSAIHCVFTEHSFPWSSLLSTHPFMRCNGAAAPTVIQRSWLFRSNKRGFIKQSHCIQRTTYHWQKQTDNRESSAVQLFRWGLYNSP